MSFFVFCFSLLALVSMNELGGETSNIFFMFTPKIWGRCSNPIWLSIFFKLDDHLETFQIQLVHYIIQFDYSRGGLTTNQIPSLKLTWHLKIHPWKRRFLLKTIIGELFGSTKTTVVVGRGSVTLGTIGPWQFGWYLLRWVAWRDGWSQDRTDTWWSG